MKKNDLTEKEKSIEANRLTWFQLEGLNNEEKSALIDEYGCILIFDSKFMRIYRIETMEL